MPPVQPAQPTRSLAAPGSALPALRPTAQPSPVPPMGLTARERAMKVGVPVAPAPRQKRIALIVDRFSELPFLWTAAPLVAAYGGAIVALRPPAAMDMDTAKEKAAVIAVITTMALIVVEMMKSLVRDAPIGSEFTHCADLADPPVQRLFGRFSSSAQLAHKALACIGRRRLLLPSLEFTPEARLDLERAGMASERIDQAQQSLLKALGPHMALFDEATVLRLPPARAQATVETLVRARLDLQHIGADGRWTPDGRRAESGKLPPGSSTRELLALMETGHKTTMARAPDLFPEAAALRHAQAQARRWAVPASTPRPARRASTTIEPGPAIDTSTPVGADMARLRDLPDAHQDAFAVLALFKQAGSPVTDVQLRDVLGKGEQPVQAMMQIFYDACLIDVRSKGDGLAYDPRDIPARAANELQLSSKLPADVATRLRTALEGLAQPQAEPSA